LMLSGPRTPPSPAPERFTPSKVKTPSPKPATPAPSANLRALCVSLPIRSCQLWTVDCQPPFPSESSPVICRLSTVSCRFPPNPQLSAVDCRLSASILRFPSSASLRALSASALSSLLVLLFKLSSVDCRLPPSSSFSQIYKKHRGCIPPRRSPIETEPFF
jgi:hypothetical protein